MKYNFTFRSRNSALRFYDALRRENISARVVGAPRAGGSCALGVEVDEHNFRRAQMIVGYGYFDFLSVIPEGK